MVREDWNGFNVLHLAGGRVGALMLGFSGGDRAAMLNADVLYLLGADEVPVDQIGKNTFVIYQGHHGNALAARADVILPGSAYTEKNATYANTEGRVQQAKQAVFPPGEAREDWKIIRALSEVIGKKLPYDTLAQIRARLVEAHPAFAAVDRAPKAAWGNFGSGACDKKPFAEAVPNFYQTDSITRASKVMAESAAAFNGKGAVKEVKHA
jgi:NADH-quinone oxidoreductase subunit G